MVDPMHTMITRVLPRVKHARRATMPACAIDGINHSAGIVTNLAARPVCPPAYSPSSPAVKHSLPNGRETAYQLVGGRPTIVQSGVQ